MGLLILGDLESFSIPDIEYGKLTGGPSERKGVGSPRPQRGIARLRNRRDRDQECSLNGAHSPGAGQGEKAEGNHPGIIEKGPVLEMASNVDRSEGQPTKKDGSVLDSQRADTGKGGKQKEAQELTPGVDSKRTRRSS